MKEKTNPKPMTFEEYKDFLNGIIKEKTKPHLLTIEERHEAHLKMAKSYLESKWDSSYYVLEDVGNPRPWFRPLYIKLTNEQFCRINKREQGWEALLYEALTDDQDIKDQIVYEETKIDDIPYQSCNCILGILDPTGQMRSFEHCIYLKKEDYLKLLVIVMDQRSVTFNDLYETDYELFRTIAEVLNAEVLAQYERNKKLSYTVVFDEIEKDAKVLLGEEDKKVYLFESGQPESNRFDCIIAFFSEKKMAVRGSSNPDSCSPDFSLHYTDEWLINIDAEAVMDALDVFSYHDASIVLKDRFYGSDAFDKIKEFLENNTIHYDCILG